MNREKNLFGEIPSKNTENIGVQATRMATDGSANAHSPVLTPDHVRSDTSRRSTVTIRKIVIKMSLDHSGLARPSTARSKLVSLQRPQSKDDIKFNFTSRGKM